MHRLHFLPEVVGGWGNNCHQPGRCREIFQFFSKYSFFCYPKVFFVLAGVKKYFSFFHIHFFCYPKIFFYPGRSREIFQFFSSKFSFFVIQKYFFYPGRWRETFQFFSQLQLFCYLTSKWSFFYLNVFFDPNIVDFFFKINS